VCYIFNVVFLNILKQINLLDEKEKRKKKQKENDIFLVIKIF